MISAMHSLINDEKHMGVEQLTIKWIFIYEIVVVVVQFSLVATFRCSFYFKI